MKKVGHPSEFLFGIYELEKQLFIKKTVEVGQKNVRILILTMLYLKKTPGNIILHLCTKNLDGMNYKSWDIERDRLKLVIMGYFLPSPL